MKKIAIFIIATISFFCFYNIKTYADTQSFNSIIANNNNKNIIYLRSAWNDNLNQFGYVYYLCVANENTYFVCYDNTNYVTNDITLIAGDIQTANVISYSYYRFNVDPLVNPNATTNTNFTTSFISGDLVVCIKKDNLYNVFENTSSSQLVFESIKDYEDFLNPPGEDTWVDILFGDFTNWLEELGLTGVSGFLEWIKEGWTVKVGEGENELAINLITPTPSPIPTPTPTTIPYQTVLQPDGNGGYQIEYIYPDPSGNPTSAPMPPNNTNITNNYGSDFEYPYYNNPDNINDPYDLDIPWYLKFVFNDQTTSLSDFQDGIDATITTVNNSEEEINTVMDSMGIFPVEWLLMIGFIGAIPLVGGIISRLLKG